jgi:hypothetical protein
MMTKNFGLMALCCLASVPAFASGGAKIAQLNDASAAIEQIVLYDDGTLNIVPRDLSKPVLTAIPAASLDRALSLAESLSQDPITTDSRAAVCLIEMANGGDRALSVGQYDATSGRFVGDESRVVLTNNGCWNLSYTHPVDASGVTDAQSLETLLLAVANQALAQ